MTTLAWSSTCTAIILLTQHYLFGGIRASSEDEILGLDKAAHGEEWQVAMMAAELVEAIHNKVGPAHLMNGKVAMEYIPNSNAEKTVSVNVQVTSNSDGTIQLARQSTDPSLHSGTTALTRGPNFEFI